MSRDDLQIDYDAIDDDRAAADHDEHPPARCPWCRSGWQEVEPGSGLRYACPDCGGTGLVQPQHPDL